MKRLSGSSSAPIMAQGFAEAHPELGSVDRAELATVFDLGRGLCQQETHDVGTGRSCAHPQGPCFRKGSTSEVLVGHELLGDAIQALKARDQVRVPEAAGQGRSREPVSEALGRCVRELSHCREPATEQRRSGPQLCSNVSHNYAPRPEQISLALPGTRVQGR